MPRYPFYAFTNDITYLANVSFNLIQFLDDRHYIGPFLAIVLHTRDLSACLYLVATCFRQGITATCSLQPVPPVVLDLVNETVKPH
jgi:hypothetical protein